jgi:hypothetical protein
MYFRARTVTLVAACWLGAASQLWGQVPAKLDSLARGDRPNRFPRGRSLPFGDAVGRAGEIGESSHR